MKLSRKDFLAGAIVFIVPILTLYYAFQVTNGIPLADEWRWFRNLLLPFIDGQLGIWQYITGEYSFLGHTHFLTLLALLADYHFFSLDLVFLAYFGLVFYLLGWIILLRYFFRHTEQQSRLIIFAALITIAYFSITSDFPWLLVSFEYFYYFWALFLLLLLDMFLCGRTSFILLNIGIVFAAIFLDSFGVVVVLTSITILSLNSAFKGRNYYQPLTILAVYLMTWMALKLILGNGVPTASQSRLDTIVMLLGNLDDVVLSLLISFSQPLLDKAVLQSFFPVSYRLSQVIVGSFGCLMVVFALFSYGLDTHKARSKLPFIIFAYALIAWALILVTRYADFGVSVFDAQRFTRFFVLYYVAAGFALASSRSSNRFVFLYGALLLGAFIISAKYQYSNVSSVRAYFENAHAELIKPQVHSGDLEKFIGQCAHGYCDQTIYSLRGKGVRFVLVP